MQSLITNPCVDDHFICVSQILGYLVNNKFLTHKSVLLFLKFKLTNVRKTSELCV